MYGRMYVARYYSESLTGPQFQMRIPQDLARHLAFSSLSVPMRPAPKLELRRRALELAGAAHRMFEDLRAMDSDDLKALSRTELNERLEHVFDSVAKIDLADQSAYAICLRDRAYKGMFAAVGEVMRRPPPIRSLADRMKTLPYKGLMVLERRHAEGEYLVDAEFDACLERLFDAATSNVELQAIMAGLPRPTTPLSLTTGAEAPKSDREGDALSPNDPPSQIPAASAPDGAGEIPSRATAPAAAPEIDYRISAAFRAYRADLVERKGPDNENVANLDSRAKMFHAICGDPDIRTLTNTDLKRFIYAIAYLPAQVAREGRWTADTLRPILEANGWVDRSIPGNEEKPSIVREPTIGERTWTDKTFGPVKTAIKHYAGSNGITLRLQDFPLHLPDHMPRKKDRDSPRTRLVDELLGYGLDDGRLVQAILPFLATLTGRRVALLAHLRAENFAHEEGHWLAWADQHFTDENDGIIKRCGVKTSESMRPFVMHEIFEECGFIDYVVGLGRGWVFPSLHLAGISNPGATVQKRMGTLTEKIKNRKDGDAARERGRAEFVFHQLRHHLVGELRDQGFGERLERKQTGHAPTDAHSRYAYSFKANEISRLATLKIDSLTAAKRLLDFDIGQAAQRCLAAAEREQRRKKKTGS